MTINKIIPITTTILTTVTQTTVIPAILDLNLTTIIVARAEMDLFQIKTKTNKKTLTQA